LIIGLESGLVSYIDSRRHQEEPGPKETYPEPQQQGIIPCEELASNKRSQRYIGLNRHDRIHKRGRNVCNTLSGYGILPESNLQGSLILDVSTPENLQRQY
jgi:hypothetical protein